MNDFVEKLRLKELAEEDVYFARRDAELIEALRRKDLGASMRCADSGSDERAEASRTSSVPPL